MFTQHAKRPSIGTSAVGSGGSGRRKSSSLPPSPWSPTTRYSPFSPAEEEEEEGHNAMGDVNGSGSSSSSATATPSQHQHHNNSSSSSEKPHHSQAGPQEPSGRPLFGGFVRRVSKLGISGVRGWKGYMRVGEDQQEKEEGEGYAGGEGIVRRRKKRPWWRSPAAALTAANVLLFVVSLLVWGHANGVGRRGGRYGGDEARAPVGFDKELLFDTPTTFQAYHAYANGTPTAASNALWSALRPPGDGLVEIARTHQRNLPWAQPSKHHPSTHRAYGLSVFHQLHCLDYIRQAFYPGAMVDEFRKDDQDPVMHRDHCIDYIRQSIMCSADVTFEPVLVPQGHIDGMGATHLCRNWDRVFAWAFEHRLVYREGE
ncbi:hypothetical protein IWX49DRAFT_154217 [Phyllosticta citricarpa]|uniref:Tat pathway signal sequence n=1 Tax=Phyllosticta citricarpa TaxID=55181 RepID=A0ABR1MHX5_9PEZI